MICQNIHLLRLLSNNDVTFFIPPYQRNYEWDEEVCEIFYKDIEKVAKSNKITKPNEDQHFFGTIIYYLERSILGRPDECILVDGQQRLTTTILILIAARDCLEDQSLKETIESRYLKNNHVHGELEYKIKLKQVEADWKAFKSIILQEPLDDEVKKSRIFNNYKFFKSKLGKLGQNDIHDLIQKGLMNFSVVTIQLEPDRNPWEKPQEIFESMNSLGKPLSLADLVRNYLLLGKNSKQQNELYHKYWLRIEKNLPRDDNNFNVSAFIRDYMQLVDVASYKKATTANYKELYRNFKELFENEDHEQLIENLAEYSHEYAILAGHKSSENEKINQKIQDLKVIEVSGFYSFILKILRLRTEKKLNDSDTLAILDAIFVYAARRRILGLTHGENKNAPLLLSKIEDLLEAENKKAQMLNILSNQQYALRLPNDNELKSYLLSPEFNFYNLRISKFLLSRIEETLTKSRPALTDKNLQLEHIMPQTLNETWKKELGADYQSIHSKYLNNIGNITLIRHNLEMSNRSFEQKKEFYKNHAGLQIAKDLIIDQPNWTEKQIEQRASYLTEILIEKVLPINNELKTSHNYSSKKINRKLSFERLNLIGKKIIYFDDANIVAEVIGDKQVKFEDKNWKLSPLTREIETRKNRRNRSGAYWGVDKWKYQGKTLLEWMNEIEIDDLEDNDLE